MHTSSSTLYYFYKPVEKSRLLLLNRDHARACLPMVAFRFELDDHDDEGDGAVVVMIIMIMVITPKYASLIGHANAGVHIRPQRAKVTNPIPLHSMALKTSTLHTVSTF